MDLRKLSSIHGNVSNNYFSYEVLISFFSSCTCHVGYLHLLFVSWLMICSFLVHAIWSSCYYQFHSLLMFILSTCSCQSSSLLMSFRLFKFAPAMLSPCTCYFVSLLLIWSFLCHVILSLCIF